MITINMMSKEEFLESIFRYDELEAKYEALAKEYEKQMPDSLTNLVFEHMPKLQGEKEKFEKIIYPIAQNYTGEIWEDFNMADWMNRSKDEVRLFNVPKPKTNEVEEIELVKELQNMQQEFHAEYCDIFWKSCAEINEHNSFVFASHNKMKEIFTEIYIDDVLSLEPVYLRYFDYKLYMQADNFVQEIYSECEVI
jgi:hypothetical protein